MVCKELAQSNFPRHCFHQVVNMVHPFQVSADDDSQVLRYGNSRKQVIIQVYWLACWSRAKGKLQYFMALMVVFVLIAHAERLDKSCFNLQQGIRSAPKQSVGW